MLFENRITVDDLASATAKQRIAHDLYVPGEVTQAELDPLIGAKSGRAVAMRLHRMRARLGIFRRQPAQKKRPAVFHQLSIFDGL